MISDSVPLRLMHCNGEAHNRILKQIAKTLKTYINVKTTNWLFKTDHLCSPENSFPETFSIALIKR